MAADVDLNLSIGVFRVTHDSLSEGTKLRKVDKVVFQ